MRQHDYPARVRSKIQSCTGLCVGLDPSEQLLLSWGVSNDLSGLKHFCDRMVAVCIKAKVGFVKPQSAFYERFGWQGLQVLADMNYRLRQAGIFTLLDCKRGDIASTAEAYAEAYLSEGDFYKYDAITISPYLGYASHEPFIKRLKAENVGVFIVIRSSNPDAHCIQEAIVSGGDSVAIWLANKIKKDNAAIYGAGNLGAIGAVVGATLGSLDELLEAMDTSFFLCPGIGAQGGTIASTIQYFKRYVTQCIFPISRGISLNTPKEEALIDTIRKIQDELIELT